MVNPETKQRALEIKNQMKDALVEEKHLNEKRMLNKDSANTSLPKHRKELAL